MTYRAFALKGAALSLLLAASSLVQAAPVNYDFSFDTFSHNGITYEGGNFSFTAPDFLLDLQVITLDSPVEVLGFQFTEVGMGSWGNATETYALQMPWFGAMRGAAGSVVGIGVTIPGDVGDTGTFALPNLGNQQQPGYSFYIATGCLSACGSINTYTRVTTSGSVTITDLENGPGPGTGPVGVPEPGTLGLLGMSLAGFGWVRRRRQQGATT